MRYVIPLLMTFVLYTITYILNKRKYAINILVLTERCTLVEEINYKLSEHINLATKKQLEMDTWPYVYCPWILDVATRIWRGRVSYSKFLQLHDSTNYKITLRSFMFWKYLMMSSSFACKKNSLSMNVIKQLFKNVCPILWLRRFLLRSSSLQEKFQMCSGTATPLPFHSSNHWI